MDQAAFNGLPISLIKILAPELAVGDALGEERVDHDEEAMRHRHRGAFGASARGQPPILRGRVRVFGARSGACGFHQGGAQPGAALARAPATALAGALVVAWTQPGPGGEVARTGKAAQIGADLGEERLRRPPADARDRLQSLQFSLKRAQALAYLRAHPLQTGIEEVDVRELLRDQEALMCAELAGERLLQLGDLLTQSPARQLRERCRIGRSADQRLQDIAPRLAQDVSRHGRQLDVRPFEHFLQPVDLVGALVDERRAVAREFTQFTLRPIRDDPG